jgi:hypothetical protein
VGSCDVSQNRFTVECSGKYDLHVSLQWQSNETFCNTGNPTCGPPFVSAWLSAHKEDAANLGKPIVVGEFGKQLGGAKPYFQAVYDQYNNSTSSDGNLRGNYTTFASNVWCTRAHPVVNSCGVHSCAYLGSVEE